MSKGIGRLGAVGFKKESTRGTAQSSASYWAPFTEEAIDEKFENVTQDEAYGIIEDSVGQFRTKNWVEGTVKLPLTDQTFPLLAFAMLGANADATHSGETVVYDHTATVGESAQHQSLTLFIHDPLAAVDYSYALGVVHKMDFDVELKKFADLSISVKAQKGVSQSTFSPSIAAENRFLPQYMQFVSAPTIAGANGTLTCTGTAATTIHVTSTSINTNLLKVGMRVTGTNIPAGATIAKIVSSTAYDLSIATTGNIGTQTFSGAIVQLKSFKLSLDANLEDDDVLGSTSPVDFLNKQFKCEFSLEAIWQNESDFKTASLATPTTPQAIIVSLINTDVSIGSVPSNPQVVITLNQAYFTEISRPFKTNDLVYQTIKGKATFKTADSQMLSILTTNTIASY